MKLLKPFDQPKKNQWVFKPLSPLRVFTSAVQITLDRVQIGQPVRRQQQHTGQKIKLFEIYQDGLPSFSSPNRRPAGKGRRRVIHYTTKEEEKNHLRFVLTTEEERKSEREKTTCRGCLLASCFAAWRSKVGKRKRKENAFNRLKE